MFVPSHFQTVFGGGFPAADTNGCAKICTLHLQGLQLSSPSALLVVTDRQARARLPPGEGPSYTSCSWEQSTGTNTLTQKFSRAGYGLCRQLEHLLKVQTHLSQHEHLALKLSTCSVLSLKTVAETLLSMEKRTRGS